MLKSLKILATAALFAATASAANAAPASPVGDLANGLTNNLVQVHGNHRACARDRGGWHRHNRFGERRPCRVWRGQGRRPDACVKFGPIFYCDY